MCAFFRFVCLHRRHAGGRPGKKMILFMPMDTGTCALFISKAGNGLSKFHGGFHSWETFMGDRI